MFSLLLGHNREVLQVETILSSRSQQSLDLRVGSLEATLASRNIGLDVRYTFDVG